MQKSLINSSLFHGLEHAEIVELLDAYPHREHSYSKGEVIALMNSTYKSLMIVTEGTISAETHDRAQNKQKVERISAPSLIAPSHLFAENNKLPATLTARTGVNIISIGREDLCDMMCRNRTVMINFLEISSSSNRFISENVVYLTYKTIKGKFANYLLDQIEMNNSSSFRNTLTQREMAEMFGVTRPALARAIGELAQEGTIFVKGKEITVLFTEKLRQYAKY